MKLPIVTSKYDYVNIFFNQLAPIVVNEYIKRYGQHRLYPSTVLAMAALESGYNLNATTLFGIKGYGKELDTTEYINNSWCNVKANFRLYPSISASVQGLYDLMQIDRYHPACDCTDWEDECKILQQCGYATDPEYANKLISIINANKLTMFNSLNILVDDESESTSEDEESKNTSEEYTTYIVQRGDNLWNIVKEYYNLDYGVDIANKVNAIVSYNNIKNPNIIYEGQEIKMI